MSNVRIDSQTMTDIADSIRSKLGVEATYKPSDMAGAIESIPTGVTPSGTININTNGSHDVTNYAMAEVNVPIPELPLWSSDGKMYYENMFIPEGVTSITGYQGMSVKMLKISSTVVSFGIQAFRNCGRLTTVDFSEATSLTTLDNQCFRNCYSLTEVNLLNTALTRIGSETFSVCTAMTTLSLPATITSMNTTSGNYSSFYGCSALKTVNLGNGFLCSIKFQWSTQFTADDIVAMFNKLGDVPSGETRTFTLGATNLAKLTDAQKQIATDKGWTLA